MKQSWRCPCIYYFYLSLSSVKPQDSLQQTLNVLPDDALIGLITFGTYVNVRGITEDIIFP